MIYWRRAFFSFVICFSLGSIERATAGGFERERFVKDGIFNEVEFRQEYANRGIESDSEVGFATRHGFFEAMKHLLDSCTGEEAHPDHAIHLKRDHNQASPLFLAAQQMHLDCVVHLLMKGACPEKTLAQDPTCNVVTHVIGISTNSEHSRYHAIIDALMWPAIEASIVEKDLVTFKELVEIRRQARIPMDISKLMYDPLFF